MKKMILAVLFSALVFAFGACASSADVAEQPVEEATTVEAEVEVAADAEAAE